MRKQRKKAKSTSGHHLIPKCRGGKVNERNILELRKKRHKAWHILFGAMTLDEAIELLQRMKRAKSVL